MKKTVLFVFLFTFLSNVFGQDSKMESVKIQILKGLKKFTIEEPDSNKTVPKREFKVNLTGTSFYDDNMNLLEPMKISSITSSGEYRPDFYTDSMGKIKVCIFRKATEEEKIRMRNYVSNESNVNNGDVVDFDVADIYGKEYSLDSLKGKIIVLNFWFIECVPCVQEMPELNKLVEKYKNKNVVFLGFSTNKRSKIMEFLKDHKFQYNIIAESFDVIQSFQVYSFPTNLVIDQNAKIAYSRKGLGTLSIEAIDKTIERLLSK